MNKTITDCDNKQKSYFNVVKVKVSRKMLFLITPYEIREIQ